MPQEVVLMQAKNLVNVMPPGEEHKVSHGLQLHPPWRIPTAAVS